MGGCDHCGDPGCFAIGVSLPRGGRFHSARPLVTLFFMLESISNVAPMLLSVLYVAEWESGAAGRRGTYRWWTFKHLPISERPPWNILTEYRVTPGENTEDSRQKMYQTSFAYPCMGAPRNGGTFCKQIVRSHLWFRIE